VGLRRIHSENADPPPAYPERIAVDDVDSTRKGAVVASASDAIQTGFGEVDEVDRTPFSIHSPVGRLSIVSSAVFP
jgi:hypothetical protein